MLEMIPVHADGPHQPTNIRAFPTGPYQQAVVSPIMKVENALRWPHLNPKLVRLSGSGKQLKALLSRCCSP